jgi:hypothetical protein
MADRDIRDFELQVVLLGTSVRTVVQSALVTMASQSYFGKDPEHEIFAWNPANMVPYQALKALEDRSIVEIAELLKDEHKMIPAGLPIPRKEELRNHRDALSHPTKIKWHRPGMQQFFDSHRQWTDFRAAIVGDMWNSMTEALKESGGKVQDASIGIGSVHATMLHTILRYAMKPDKLAELPSETVLFEHLQKLLGQFVAFVAAKRNT